MHRSKKPPRMSEMGHSRRFRNVRGMSALPPIATDARTFWIGSLVPTADIADLFDHLVGAGE
jgi:hypothetical protein